MDRIPGVTRRCDGTVRVRPTGGRRLLDATANSVLAGGWFLITGWEWLWLVPVVTLVVLGDLLMRRPGITLRPREAVVHGPLRTRRVPWSRVQAVTVDEHGGRSVLLWVDDRTRIRLAQPSSLRGTARFDAVVDLIGRHWLTHRGPEWAPAW